MAGYIVFLALLWGGTMGFTLLVTRFRLTSGDATVWDQLAVRGVALFTVCMAMLTLSTLASRIAPVPDAARLVPFLWLASAAPLLVPTIRSNGVTLVSAESWIYLSLALTVAAGFVLALVTVAQLLLGGVILE